MQDKNVKFLQWSMVMIVLGATIFMATKNNESSVVFNLCTLCFGYYFGTEQSNPPESKA